MKKTKTVLIVIISFVLVIAVAVFTGLLTGKLIKNHGHNEEEATTSEITTEAEITSHSEETSEEITEKIAEETIIREYVISTSRIYVSEETYSEIIVPEEEPSEEPVAKPTESKGNRDIEKAVLEYFGNKRPDLKDVFIIFDNETEETEDTVSYYLRVQNTISIQAPANKLYAYVTVNKNDGKMTTDNMFEVTTDYLW